MKGKQKQVTIYTIDRYNIKQISILFAHDRFKIFIYNLTTK